MVIKNNNLIKNTPYICNKMENVKEFLLAMDYRPRPKAQGSTPYLEAHK